MIYVAVTLGMIVILTIVAFLGNKYLNTKRIFLLENKEDKMWLSGGIVFVSIIWPLSLPLFGVAVLLALAVAIPLIIFKLMENIK